MPLITFTSDFGHKDWFVGSMKAAMLSVSARLRIVDITHEIPPGDIKSASFALASSYRYFPPGTIHLAVVDPGVGSSRNAIVVKTSNFTFLGPDNGILSYALADEEIESIHLIENTALFLQPISRTFHGRDIFAPVAAHIARGLPHEQLGKPLISFTKLDRPKPRVENNQIIGEVIYIDQFGNAITNLPANLIEDASPAPTQLFLYNGTAIPIGHYYNQTTKGSTIAIMGSNEYLEIAVNLGNAADSLGLSVGDLVTVK